MMRLRVPIAGPCAQPVAGMRMILVVLLMSGVTTLLHGCRSSATRDEASLAAGSADSLLSEASAAETIDPGFKTVPNDTVTTQTGKLMALGDLKGNVWVVDFIFTRCTGPCPLMTRRMAEIARHFKDSNDVRLVSVSVDPTYDTPDRLAEYGRSYGADSSRWLFVTTGDKNRTWDLAMKGFALSAGEDSTSAGRGVIFHDERLVVVDRRGEIRGYVHTADPGWLKKTTDRVVTLLQEREPG